MFQTWLSPSKTAKATGHVEHRHHMAEMDHPAKAGKSASEGKTRRSCPEELTAHHGTHDRACCHSRDRSSWRYSHEGRDRRDSRSRYLVVCRFDPRRHRPKRRWRRQDRHAAVSPRNVQRAIQLEIFDQYRRGLVGTERSGGDDDSWRDFCCDRSERQASRRCIGIDCKIGHFCHPQFEVGQMADAASLKEMIILKQFQLLNLWGRLAEPDYAGGVGLLPALGTVVQEIGTSRF